MIPVQADDPVLALRQDNQQLKDEIVRLRAQVQQLTQQRDHNAGSSDGPAPGHSTGTLSQQHQHQQPSPAHPLPATNGAAPPDSTTSHATAALFRMPHSLTKEQVERYSRHLLLPSVGLAAQERLCGGSVLVVGCGGLGSPAALYLTAAGVGRVGVVDHDVVDSSNLHRQVIHTEARVGTHKASSAAATLTALNSLVQVEVHRDGLRPSNALSLVSQYDVIVDATDNPYTRYLLSDACVVAGKPLVSAAAVGTDGQLTIYNWGPEGPCYRCLFPEAPAPENCSRCADAGVLGPVPGVMGVLQAVEAVKVLGGMGEPLARRLLLYDALAGKFTTVKLRGKSAACVACGLHPTITATTLGAYDYTAFTGQGPSDGPLPPVALVADSERLTVQQLQAGLSHGASVGQALVVLDVRPATQVDLYQLPGAVHVPFEQLESRLAEMQQLAVQAAGGRRAAVEAAATADAHGSSTGVDLSTPVGQGMLCVLCRRGNNSQKVVARLRQTGIQNVVDVIGGVEAWVRQVQTELPSI